MALFFAMALVVHIGASLFAMILNTRVERTNIVFLVFLSFLLRCFSFAVFSGDWLQSSVLFLRFFCSTLVFLYPADVGADTQDSQGTLCAQVRELEGIWWVRNVLKYAVGSCARQSIYCLNTAGVSADNRPILPLKIVIIYNESYCFGHTAIVGIRISVLDLQT